MSDEATTMRAAWNQRAEKDAFHYIETDHWDGDLQKFFAFGEELAQTIIDPKLPERRGVALDIGCGVGRFTRALSKRFEKAIGLDVSDEMVARGTALQREVANLELRATDGQTYPVESDSVDFVFSYVVFQHMPSRAVIQKNIEEVARVMRPGATAHLHFKARFKSPLHAAYQALPASVLIPFKQLAGKDPLKFADDYRGVGPISTSELTRRFEQAGLKVLQIENDATHLPSHEYVFVTATR